MRRFGRILAVALPLLAGGGLIARADEAAPEPSASAPILGRQIPNFALEDIEGGVWSLEGHSAAPVVVVIFLGTECPLAQRYAPRLAELAESYAARGVAFVAVAPNRQDTLDELRSYAETYGLRIPLVKDLGNVVADRFGARRTPEAFVLDRERRVRYFGRIDDQYGIGYKRPQREQDFVARAIDDLLASRAPRAESSEAVGCLIGRERLADESSPVTWCGQISRIFAQHCQVCHRPGEIAPFSLLDYEHALGWEAMIEEVVAAERMPPWHASPAVGDFLNNPRLSAEEKELIYEWVRRGAPKGDESELPAPREFPDGWPIGQPDEVIYLGDKPYLVPAEGRAEYAFFFVDPGFTEDKWVKWSWCRPDNSAVVHHINVYFRPPWQSWNDWLGGMVNLISGFLPGQTIPERPFDGTAILIPAGSELLFEMHYTPNGPGQYDRSSLGLVYADPAEVTREAYHAAAFNSTFAIPPHAAEHKVQAAFQLTQAARLEFMSPHMHLRGKNFLYEAIFPDGQCEKLLDVQGYDYDWQTVYWLRSPRELPLGTRIECEAVFDNSRQNLRNPDPDATVHWSGYTEDEMMVGVLGLSTPMARSQTVRPKATASSLASNQPDEHSTAPRSEGEKSLDRVTFLQNRHEYVAAREHLRAAAVAFGAELAQGGAGLAPYRGLARVAWLKFQNFAWYYRYWLGGYFAAINGLMLLALVYQRASSRWGWPGLPTALARLIALAGGSPIAGLGALLLRGKAAAAARLRLGPIFVTQLAACGAAAWLIWQTQ